MSKSMQVSVTLSDESLEFIRRKVSSGDFMDENELVNAGIEEMRERDAEIEYWLQHVGGPIYDRMKADPSRGIPAEEVLKRIEERSYAIQKSA